MSGLINRRLTLLAIIPLIFFFSSCYTVLTLPESQRVVEEDTDSGYYEDYGDTYNDYDYSPFYYDDFYGMYRGYNPYRYNNPVFRYSSSWNFYVMHSPTFWPFYDPYYFIYYDPFFDPFYYSLYDPYYFSLYSPYRYANRYSWSLFARYPYLYSGYYAFYTPAVTIYKKRDFARRGTEVAGRSVIRNASVNRGSSVATAGKSSDNAGTAARRTVTRSVKNSGTQSRAAPGRRTATRSTTKTTHSPREAGRRVRSSQGTQPRGQSSGTRSVRRKAPPKKNVNKNSHFSARRGRTVISRSYRTKEFKPRDIRSIKSRYNSSATIHRFPAQGVRSGSSSSARVRKPVYRPAMPSGMRGYSGSGTRSVSGGSRAVAGRSTSGRTVRRK